MASSLPLPSADQLAGAWQLTFTTPNQSRHTSLVTLEAHAHAAPNTFTLHFSDDRFQHAGGTRTDGWRPTPDGIALTDHSAMTVLFLAKNRQRYRTQPTQGGRTVLMPLTPHPDLFLNHVIDVMLKFSIQNILVIDMP